MQENRFRSFVSIDIEATGMDPLQDSIIEIGACKVVDGKVTDTFRAFAKPKGPLDPLISIITGIHDADLIDAAPFESLITSLKEFVSDMPILGHNIPFDLAFFENKGLIFPQEKWDSHVLSSILFPTFRSHSLESLCKQFRISHEAHRALGDAQATAELWLRLVDEVGLFDSGKKQTVSDAVKKSSWVLKDIWLLPARTGYTSFLQEKRFSFTHSEYTEDFTGKSVLLECFGVDKRDVAISVVSQHLKKSERVLVVGAYYFLLDQLLQFFQTHNVDGVYFDRASSYLDWSKLEVFLKNKSLSPEEAIFAARILLHHDRGQKVHRGGLALFPKDDPFWNAVSSDEANEERNSEAADLLQKPLVCMSQHHFFGKTASDPHFVSKFAHVVFLDCQLIEQNLTWIWGSALDSRKAEGTVLSFLQSFYTWVSSRIPSAPFTQSILLHETLKDGDYRRLQAEGLALSHPVLDTFFGDDPSCIRWLRFDSNGFISLHASPLSVGPRFKESVLDRVPHTLIADRGFFPAPIGFDGEKRDIVSSDFADSLEIVLPDLSEISGTKRDGDAPSQQEFFLRQILLSHGRSAFVFSSRRVLQKFFMDLQPQLAENNIPYIAEGITGGRGKMVDLIEEGFHSDRLVLFCTHRFLPLFMQEDLQLHSIFFQSLPFDPFGDPILQKRSELMRDSFTEYTLPKTLQNFGVVFDKMTLESGSKKHIYLLDRRVQEKSYGGAFLRFFPKGANIA